MSKTDTRDGDPLARLDPTAAAATRWFLALQDDVPDEAMLRAFAVWREADPRHAAAFDRLERIWSASGGAPALKHGRVDRRTVLRGVAVGTVILGTAAGGRMLLGPHPMADHATRAGERRTVILPDGSTAMLSTRTALSLDFDAGRRSVRLLDGEAWFRVVADPAGRPFQVEAGGGRTTALGTAFAVASADGAVAVSVTEHAVEVTVGKARQRLRAGQGVLYRASHIEAPRPLDAEELAWRSGRLVFVSRPLGEVVRTIDRWRAGRTVVVGAELAARPVTVMIDAAAAREELRRLADTLPVQVLELTPLLTVVRAL